MASVRSLVAVSVSFVAVGLVVCSSALYGQQELIDAKNTLDPSRLVSQPRTVGSYHTPLPEQYIWTADDAAVVVGKGPLSQLKRDDWKMEPHYFRKTFNLSSAPKFATLYVAGPRLAKVWINGDQVAELHYDAGHHMGFGTMTVDVSSALHAGKNVIALEVVRGYGSHHHTNALKTSWLNSGEVLTAKIVPAEEGVYTEPVLITDASWKSSTRAADGWQEIDFEDRTWKPVTSLGGIESSVDFFQWNADGGLYAWPGYLGEAPYMANYRLAPQSSEQRPEGLLLDFGRELNGRIVIAADAHSAAAQVSYGESLGELFHAPFLGKFEMKAPPNSEVRGPKAGFRYALVKLDGSSSGVKILAEGIFYPVSSVGSFSSSDPMLNRIWESAAYTAHLAMQDSLLDGIKRDRGRWIGDNEVIDRSVMDLYGDTVLVKQGLEDSIGPDPVTGHVNGLPGYSAWWVVSEAEYIRRFGDLSQLQQVKARMLQLLDRMRGELDDRHVYVAASREKPFVDWSPGLSSDSPEARRATHFEYLLAMRDAAWLLQLAGDKTNASRYQSLANEMNDAAQKFLKDPNGTFGDRWQTNAIAVLAGAVHGSEQEDAVWSVLKRVAGERKPTDVITPYYGDYLLQAMASLGHRQEAVQWMRAYWGSMLDAGATSFWEAWDPSWAGPDPHAKLQADDKVGYYTSLAHGWSSGPSSWLPEEVLGVRALDPGFHTVQIRPDLAGLEWAKGSIATPLGAVQVEMHSGSVHIQIPKGMVASVLLPSGEWQSGGVRATGERVEDGQRVKVQVQNAGQFEWVRK